VRAIRAIGRASAMADKKGQQKGIGGFLGRSLLGRLIGSSGDDKESTKGAKDGQRSKSTRGWPIENNKIHATAELARLSKAYGSRRDSSIRQRTEAAHRATLAAELGEARTFMSSHLRTHESFYEQLRTNEVQLVKTYENLITHKAEKTLSETDKLAQRDIPELKTTLCSLIELTSQVKEKLKLRIATLRSCQDVLNTLIGKKNSLERTVGIRVAGYLSNCTFSSIRSRETYDNFEFQTVLSRALAGYREYSRKNAEQQKRRQNRLNRAKAGNVWLSPRISSSDDSKTKENDEDFVSGLLRNVSVIVNDWTATMESILLRLRSSDKYRKARIKSSKNSQQRKSVTKHSSSGNQESPRNIRAKTVPMSKIEASESGRLRKEESAAPAKDEKNKSTYSASQVETLQEQLKSLQAQHERSRIEMEQEFQKQLDEFREGATQSAASTLTKHRQEMSKLQVEVRILRGQLEAAAAVQSTLEEQNLQLRGALKTERERLSTSESSLKKVHTKDLEKEKRRYRRMLEKAMNKEEKKLRDSNKDHTKVLQKKDKDIEALKKSLEISKQEAKKREGDLHKLLKHTQSLGALEQMKIQTELQDKVSKLTAELERVTASHKADITSKNGQIADILKDAKEKQLELSEANNVFQEAFHISQTRARGLKYSQSILMDHALTKFAFAVRVEREIETEDILKEIKKKDAEIEKKIKEIAEETEKKAKMKLEEVLSAESAGQKHTEALKEKEEIRARADAALIETKRLEAKERKKDEEESKEKSIFKLKDSVRTRYGDGEVIKDGPEDSPGTSIVVVQLDFGIGYFPKSMLTRTQGKKTESSLSTSSISRWIRRKILSKTTTTSGGTPPTSRATSRSGSRSPKRKAQTVTLIFQRESIGLTCTGSKVTFIKSGGQAEKLGVKVGWHIIEVEGKTVDAMGVIPAIRAALMGSNATFSLLFRKNRSESVISPKPMVKSSETLPTAMSSPATKEANASSSSSLKSPTSKPSKELARTTIMKSFMGRFSSWRRPVSTPGGTKTDNISEGQKDEKEKEEEKNSKDQENQGTQEDSNTSEDKGSTEETADTLEKKEEGIKMEDHDSKEKEVASEEINSGFENESTLLEEKVEVTLKEDTLQEMEVTQGIDSDKNVPENNIAKEVAKGEGTTEMSADLEEKEDSTSSVGAQEESVSSKSIRDLEQDLESSVDKKEDDVNEKYEEAKKVESFVKE